MLLLDPEEVKIWIDAAGAVIDRKARLEDVKGGIRANLLPVFCLYTGVNLLASGRKEEGKAWLGQGAVLEERGLFLNTYLLGFLERHGDRLELPVVCFEDPRPYVHYTTVPALRAARSLFAKTFSDSMPPFRKPLRIMDIGTGNGTMLVSLLNSLSEAGKCSEIGEILLVDQSKAMVDLARETVASAFPGTNIHDVKSRIQDISGAIERDYDIAVASLAYHHMPWEQKLYHLKRLKDRVRHFIVFEIEANNDEPEQNTPEMMLSLYQSYGKLIDLAFEHDGPVEVAIQCVDNFLMTELMSFITQPRGVRTDYHMPRHRWRELFESEVGSFRLRSETTCHADEFFEFFMLHHERT